MGLWTSLLPMDSSICVFPTVDFSVMGSLLVDTGNTRRHNNLTDLPKAMFLFDKVGKLGSRSRERLLLSEEVSNSPYSRTSI